jgi:hypothetical protein
VRAAPNREMVADWRVSPWGDGGDRKHAEDRGGSGLESGGGVIDNEEGGEGASGADEKERDSDRQLLNALGARERRKRGAQGGPGGGTWRVGTRKIEGGLAIMSGALFLRSSRVRPTLLVICERLSRTGTARRKRTPDVFGFAWEAYVPCWSDFPLQGVHRFESLRLSDISNRLFMVVIKY